VAELDEDAGDASSKDDGDSDEDKKKTPQATGGDRKWYLAAYQSQKEFTKTPDEPEMTIPLLAVTSIHKTDDQSFSVRFVDHEDGKKKKDLQFKVNGRDVDVWTDGIELFREELREMKTLAKARKAEWEKLSQQERMNQWMEHYKSQGYTDEELKKYYQQYQLAQMNDQQRTAYLKAAAKQVVASSSVSTTQQPANSYRSLCLRLFRTQVYSDIIYLSFMKNFL
jgi:hypothetical protein